MYTFYKPAWWKQLLGKLGFKKYQRNYVWGVDFGGGKGDHTVEASGYYDKNGILNITVLKVSTPTEDK